MKSVSTSVVSLVLGLLFLAGCQSPPVVEPVMEEEEKGVEFVVSFPDTVRAEALSGRVLLVLSQSEKGEPRNNIGWFSPPPLFAVDVVDLKPGESVEFTEEQFKDPDALAFPDPLSRVAPGTYWVQAVIDHDQTRRNFNTGPGNLYSESLQVELSKGLNATFTLVADQVVEAEEGKESDLVKLVKVRSDLLSEFHGRDVFLRAAVLLPSGYEEDCLLYTSPSPRDRG